MNDQQLEKIKKVRAIVLENQQLNDKLYQELINEIGLERYSIEEEFLFDAVYNSDQQDSFERSLHEFQKRIN